MLPNNSVAARVDIISYSYYFMLSPSSAYLISIKSS